MHSPAPSKEISLGPSGDIPPGSGRAFSVNGRTIAIFRTPDGTLYATQNSCPHASGELSKGAVGTTNVICPQHGWKFNLKTGVCAHDPCYRLRVYPVREENGELRVTIPEARS